MVHLERAQRGHGTDGGTPNEQSELRGNGYTRPETVNFPRGTTAVLKTERSLSSLVTVEDAPAPMQL